MTRLLVLVFLAVLTAAEIAAVLALVQWLGPILAFVVLALDVLVGITVMRWAARGPAKDRGLKITAGAFIALPGLVLDLVGLALLIPAVRQWVRSSVMRGTESALRRSGISVMTVTAPGDVIPGAVIVDEPTQAGGRPAGEPAQPPRQGGPGSPADRDGVPRVVRGEIISGEVVSEPATDPNRTPPA